MTPSRRRICRPLIRSNFNSFAGTAMKNSAITQAIIKSNRFINIEKCYSEFVIGMWNVLRSESQFPHAQESLHISQHKKPLCGSSQPSKSLYKIDLRHNNLFGNTLSSLLKYISCLNHTLFHYGVFSITSCTATLLEICLCILWHSPMNYLADVITVYALTKGNGGNNNTKWRWICKLFDNFLLD